MITLRAANTTLTQNSKYSYLTTNYSSGSSSLTIVNTEDFSVDDFILVSEFGKSDAEAFRIGTINTTTGVITLQNAAGSGTSTRNAHPESTKVYIIPYNQIRFYRTAPTTSLADETPTFATTGPLTGYTSIEPASLYTTYEDNTNTTGFGWFVWYNSVSTNVSTNSNPIPYAGYAGQTVASVFAEFDSLMNANELKLVTIIDKFNWLNESLSLIKNRLNLSNVSFLVSSEQTLTIVSGTAEYAVPSDFSDIVSITDGQNSSTSTGEDIPYMSISKVPAYNGNVTHYYLRGRNIGFVPTPTTSTSFYYRYKMKSTRVTGLSDYIILPDEGYYAIKSFMLYRCFLKFQNSGMAAQYLKEYTDLVNTFIISAGKQDANLDVWLPSPESNV